ncbi:thioesterase family protein [Streptacidiphilus melanogenes]|uniref:thioesterase family protein n=1 Tax=Streptacidiphilus melanogenes TaxID=411235 RepID=UPI0005AB74F1|nr:hotdog domain-containing protein [Streptacidiphilus melanogenes]
MQQHRVNETDTAIALGSGDVPVLATPRLIAWMEAATVEAAGPFVGPEQTSVGTAVRVDHVRATPVGGRVEVHATAGPADGRRLTFEVRAVDGDGRLVGAGEIQRVVVDRGRFLGALERPAGGGA